MYLEFWNLVVYGGMGFLAAVMKAGRLAGGRVERVGWVLLTLPWL